MKNVLYVLSILLMKTAVLFLVVHQVEETVAADYHQAVETVAVDHHQAVETAVVVHHQVVKITAEVTTATIIMKY